jgi:hypothetical protein
MVLLGLIAGAVAGSLTRNGGIASLFATQNADQVATLSDSVDPPGGATDEAGLVKPATAVEDMPSCLRSRNADTEAIRKPGLRALDHRTISALTICSVILRRFHKCDSGTRTTVVGAIEFYYGQRARAKLYVSGRANMSSDAIANASPKDREKIAEADREAQSWGGSQDQEIDAALMGLVKGGYFSPDDFKAGAAKEEIGQVLVGVSLPKKACS